MKRIQKYLAGLLCAACVLTAVPSGAYAVNDGEPAGFITQVNSVLMMPEPGGTLPTAAVNHVPHTIVMAEWTPAGTVKVDTPYNFTLTQVLGDGPGSPMYVYAQEGTVDIALQFPSGHTRSLVSQTFAEHPGIAWQIDYNYVSHVGYWVWGTVSYSSAVSFTPYHSINYNTDGGRITGSGYPTYAEDGGSISVYSLPQAEKEGYVFGGWEIDSGGGLSLSVSLEQSLAAVYGPVYLKAVWNKAPERYTLRFDANGGSGSMGSQTVTEGQTARLPNNSFTRIGYTFTGWNTKADGTGTVYNDGASISPNGNTTLYAQWRLNMYTLSFDANGGSGSMGSQTVTEGQSTRLPNNSFTREGYTFTGWNTKADGSGTAYAEDAALTLTGNTTLYAQWELVTNYTVLLPDGENIAVDPETGTGSAQIGIQAGSVIPEDKQLQMSVNAGMHYDDDAQCYRLCNNTGGQLLFYVLAYKGNEVNPGNAQGGVLLETASSNAVFEGFQNRVSVTVGTARTAGRYTDTLTFRFALV